MTKPERARQELQDLEGQAMAIRTALMAEWDVDILIELTTKLFAIENRAEQAAQAVVHA